MTLRITMMGVVSACSLLANEALAQAPPSAAPAAAPAPVAATHPMVMVHIDSPETVSLEAQTGNDWRVVCESPCDRALSGDQTYRVNGSGLRASNAFQLDKGGRVSLAVDPASSASHVGAIVVTVIGTLGLAPGLGLTAVLVAGEMMGAILICPIAAAFESVPSQQSAEYGNCLGFIGTYFGQGYAQPYVWGPALGGAVLIVAGVGWLAETKHPTVVTPTSAAAWLRLPPPMLADLPPRLEAVRLPPPAVVQIVNLSF